MKELEDCAHFRAGLVEYSPESFAAEELREKLDDMIRARFGLDGWSFHELGHSHLTPLALNGVRPKVMWELAGHYSPQTTMDIYTHVNMDAKKEAVAAVSRVF